jgi:hypothetical protein
MTLPDLSLAERDFWALLRSQSEGRPAVYANERVNIFPVNFAVDHATIVFRTAAGTKVSAVVANESVAFEADGVDLDGSAAWSVVVKGRALPITWAQELLDTSDLALYPLEGQAKQQFIRIVPVEVTGRPVCHGGSGSVGESVVPPLPRCGGMTGPFSYPTN